MKQTLKYILAHLISQRKFAEEKHSVTIALASGVIVFSSYFISSKQNVVVFVSAGSIIFALISVLYSFLALSARRVKVEQATSKTDGDMLDFKSISQFGVQNYLSALKKNYSFPNSYKIDNFDKDLAVQIITTAKVIKLKFSYFNMALIFLSLSVLCGVIAICFVAGV